MNPDDQQRSQPQSGSRGSVMDIQSGRSPQMTPPEVATPLDNSMAPAEHVAGASPSPGEVIGHQQPPRMPGQVPAEPGQPPHFHPQPSKRQPKKKRTGLIVGVVTAAVVVVLALGAGGFIWYQSQNETTPAAIEGQSETERVNVEEIDATITEIDKTLNTLDDSADITPNDVTNSSLGL